MTESSAEVHEGGHRHRDVSGGWLRAAVFGAMDGLVTNVSLIAGIGGSGAGSHAIALAGTAGLVAGAFSMAIGEYTSVRSQNEAVAGELAIEERELRVNTESETKELADYYVAHGVSRETADRFSQEISSKPAEALRIHAQQELGIDPENLPGPWLAAFSSFVCFSLGALLPLLPFLLGGDQLWMSLVIGAVALFGAGVVVSRFTNRSAFYSGGRQLLLGALATGVTYAVGAAIGAVPA